jgi:glycosyltransferase involved in cell wall biosynthesis
MIGIVSNSNPEVDRLAGEICKRGNLDLYVRRYVNRGRSIERLIFSLPGIKKLTASTFGRRQLTPGLSTDKVKDAGVAYDLAAALSLRSPIASARAGYERLNAGRDSAIARKGAQLLSKSEVIVGNYGVAAPAFRQVKARGGRAILNYPIAHHRYAQRLLEEEALREPEFASTITTKAHRLSAVFDTECELADLILVGSSFVRDTFLKEGVRAGRIEVVPYGCDTSRFFPGIEVNRKATLRALFVGQISQRKGLSYLLKANRAFHGPGTELVIVGSRVVGKADVLYPFRSTISYLGNLSHEVLAGVYRQADVFVFPTLLEGLPLAVLEAMASGLPVITTSHGPGDLVRDGIEGFIVPIRDPEAIADRLEYMRRHPEARALMGRAARERALEFTWKAYCDRATQIVLSQFEGLTSGYRGDQAPSPEPQGVVPRTALL